MAGMSAPFRAHLERGVTTLCRCWAIERADGRRFGFTDHDRTLCFEGFEFKADSGFTARALQQGTGLSVDNTEAMGALSDAAVTELDIEAGRFDGAALRVWLVDWTDVTLRWLQFRGTLGQIQRSGGAFHAELRGLTEALNRPLGRVFQKPCTAVLGDDACGFDLSKPGYRAEIELDGIQNNRAFRWDVLDGFEPGWFTRGRLDVLTGAAQGLWGMIKSDTVTEEGRAIELWEPLRAELAPGDQVRLTAGCDKRMETCRLKFDNLVNYQGFPDIPGEDWVMAVPKSGGPNSGGSRR